MPWWVPLGMAAMQAGGAIARGLMHEGDPWTSADYSAAQKRAAETLTGPEREPYGAEAIAAAERINAINNPWIDSAIADQDYMRELQEGYTADLLAQAQGAKSYAREESARQEEMQHDLLSTMAASTRDRFASPGAQSRALQEQAALHQNLLLPTERAAAAEMNAAQDMLTRVYGGQYQQDLTLEDLERRKRDLLDRGGLYGALAALGHYQMGGAEQRAGTQEETGMTGHEAKDKRNT